MTIEVLKQMVAALKACNRSDMKEVNEAIQAGLDAIAELESQQEQPKQVNELHTCPYREELYGDYETLCACDREATHQCAMDI
jgi:hypothetical protein